MKQTVLVTFEIVERVRQLEYKKSKEFASEYVGTNFRYKTPADYLNAMERRCFRDDGVGGDNTSRQILTVQIF